MKRLAKWAVFLAVPLLLVLAVSAAAGSTPTRRLKHATGPITTLAMDGPRVVYTTAGAGVYVWNVRSGATSQARPLSGSGDVPFVQNVALAGNRVAWITRTAIGNSQETTEDLFTASLSGAGTRKLAHAFRSDGYSDGGVELWGGDWIGGLVGSGKLLLVNQWTTEPTSNLRGLAISDARLSLIGLKSGRLQPVAAGEEAIVAKSADAGRVAVLRPQGSVGIYSATGVLLRQITPSSSQEIAMGGGRLVVLTKTKTLEAYDSRTGTLEHSWPIKTRHPYLQVGHLQAYGRIALFSVDPRSANRNLRILDLKTGKSIALPTIPRSAWNDATVGPLGVVYAVNDYRAFGKHHPSGALVFLSTARVLAGIAKGHLR